MIEIVFITSSKEKLAHAEYLCREYDVSISKQKQYGKTYTEPRLQNRDELLKQSIKDAIRRWKNTITNKEKFFFIEDTSVKINALSKEDIEYPGVDVKYWMQENTFDDIDLKLKALGNDRSVIVRSDVVLFLPESLQHRFNTEYKTFTSQIEGNIVEAETPVATQPLYPWLSGKTFNKWFIPKGSNTPLSVLDIVEADAFDFRKGAFQEMLDFLETNKLIHKKTASKAYQKSLFNNFIFIVCGLSCAGKSTIAEYLRKQYGYYHLEASDFMYLSYYEKHGTNSQVTISDFAKEVLIKNPGIVASQIVKQIKALNSRPLPLIITGFRSPKEIECFKDEYYSADTVLAYIDAPAKIRFSRSLQRSRHDTSKKISDFIEMDKKQESMGLSDIKLLAQENIVLNDKTFNEFYSLFEEKFDVKVNVRTLHIERKSSMPNRLEDVILLTLLLHFKEAKFYTTTFIARLINETFPDPENPERRKHKDNVSRYFNQNFHPYYEIDLNERGNRTYRLSQTGKAHAQWLLEFYPALQKTEAFE